MKKVVLVKQIVMVFVILFNIVLIVNFVIIELVIIVIFIEFVNFDVVYIFNYNLIVVYGNWVNIVYLLVYLLLLVGELFVDSFVCGFGYSMGVVIMYVLFSSIDWDDDDYDYYHHDNDDYYYYDGGYCDGNGW